MGLKWQKICQQSEVSAWIKVVFITISSSAGVVSHNGHAVAAKASWRIWRHGAPRVVEKDGTGISFLFLSTFPECNCTKVARLNVYINKHSSKRVIFGPNTFSVPTRTPERSGRVPTGVAPLYSAFFAPVRLWSAPVWTTDSIQVRWSRSAAAFPSCSRSPTCASRGGWCGPSKTRMPATGNWGSFKRQRGLLASEWVDRNSTFCLWQGRMLWK